MQADTRKLFERKGFPARPSSARGDPKASELSSNRPHRPFSASKSASQNNIARKIRIYANSNTYDPTIIARMRPAQIPQDKERLYDDTLLLKMQVNALRDENMKLKTRLSQVQHEGEDRASANLVSSLKQTVKDLQHYAKRRDEDVAILKRNMKNSRVTELEVELQTYIEECSRLKKLLEESGLARNAELRAEDLEDNLKQQISINSSLRQEVKQLTAVLHDTNEQYEQAQQLVRQMERKMKPKRSQEQIQMLGLEVQKLKTQLQDTENAVNERDLKVTSLTEESKSRQEECRRLEKELGEKKETIKTLESQIQSVRKSVNSTTRTIRDLEVAKGQLDEKVSTLSRTMTSKDSELHRLKHDLSEQRKSYEDRISRSQEEWNSEKAAYESSLSAQKKELDDTLSRLQWNLMKVKELTAASEDLQEQVGTLQEQVGALQSQVSQAEESRTAVQSHCTQVEAELDQTKSRFDTAEANLQETAAQRDTTAAELRTVTGDLKAAERNLDDEKRKTAEYQAKNHQLELACQRLHHKVAQTLTKKLEKLRKALHKRNQTVETFLDDVDKHRTGVVTFKELKKALKPAKPSKLALKVVAVLAETDEGTVSLRKLRDLMALEGHSESSSSEEEEAPMQFLTEPPLQDEEVKYVPPASHPVEVPESASPQVEEVPAEQPKPLIPLDSESDYSDPAEYEPAFEPPSIHKKEPSFPSHESSAEEAQDSESVKEEKEEEKEETNEPALVPPEEAKGETAPQDTAPLNAPALWPLGLPEQSTPAKELKGSVPYEEFEVGGLPVQETPNKEQPAANAELEADENSNKPQQAYEEAKDIVPSPGLSSDHYDEPSEHSSSSSPSGIFQDAQLPIEVIGEVRQDASSETSAPHRFPEADADTTGNEEALRLLTRHAALRLQMNRMTADQIAEDITKGAATISGGSLKFQVSQPPLAITDPRDQQLLVLACLRKPLTEANMSRKWDETILPAADMKEAMAAHLGTWDVFTQEDEAAIDQVVTVALESRAEDFRRACIDLDSDKKGYISFSEFERVVQTLKMPFDEKTLRYLILLFYSLDQQLDRVHYETFLNAYVAPEEDPIPAESSAAKPGLSDEEQTAIVKAQVDRIAKALGRRHVKNAFEAGQNGLITQAQFRTALNQLGVIMPDDVFEVVMSGLQFEGAAFPCISLMELKEFLTSRRPQSSASSSSSDESELEYAGEEFEASEDRM